MYSRCIPVLASGNHRIQSRYIQHMHAVGGCGANTNVSSHIRVAWHRDTKYVHDTSKKQARYSLIQVALHVSCIYPARQSSTLRDDSWLVQGDLLAWCLRALRAWQAGTSSTSCHESIFLEILLEIWYCFLICRFWKFPWK